MRLWDKGEPLDERVLRYTAGEDHRLDARLVPYDVRASIAHAAMLHEVGLLAADDFAAIREGLEALGAEHAAGEWRIELADEDVHTALESRLIRRIGDGHVESSGPTPAATMSGPAPAATVSSRCSAGESSGAIAAARPPCASGLDPSPSLPFSRTTARVPSGRAHAAKSPAIPAPTMQTSASTVLLTDAGAYPNGRSDPRPQPH